MLHIFVDESGVPGASENLVIGFAFFADMNYKICVDAIKLKIKASKGDEPKELHFHKMHPVIRKEFLSRLVELDGKFGYIHVTKAKLNENFKKHPDNNLMYNLVLFYLIENLVNKGYSDDNITVYVDQRSSNKDIKRGLSRYLPMKINPLLGTKRLYVRWEKSHNSRGIQCADSICGGANRKIEKGDNQYYDIIKKNCIVARENLFGL
jgi:hypothetical protein